MAKSNAKVKVVDAGTNGAATSVLVNGVAITVAQRDRLETMATTSDRIRYLSAEQFTTSQIKDVLGIRYQHVRNVLITPVKNPGARGRPVKAKV